MDSVEEDLCAPLLQPPGREISSAWKVCAANGKTMARVCYLAADNATTRSIADEAVEALAEAMDAGEYTPDEKTGGGYVVAGNGCMQSIMTHRVRNGENKSFVVPYTRSDTFKPGVQSAVRRIAPLMGLCAEHIGRTFPETTAGLAAAVRHPSVCKDLFMYPSHEEQRHGLPSDDSNSGSIAAHQLAMRLSGRLRKMKATRADYQLCALHLDRDDAQRVHGSPLVYALLLEEGAELKSAGGCELENRPMRASDLVLFEHGDGGRCVRVQTACLHHICIVIFCSDELLHGNVFPDSLEVQSPCGLALLRLVPYGRRGIDRFTAAIAQDEALWREAIPLLDRRLTARWAKRANEGTVAMTEVLQSDGDDVEDAVEA